jgi:predicted acylesterase/phospholipase RssA
LIFNTENFLAKRGGQVRRTFMLSMSKEILEKAKKFDLFVAPQELMNYKILDPEKAAELFSIGYKATKKKMKEIDISRIANL